MAGDFFERVRYPADLFIFILSWLRIWIGVARNYIRRIVR